LHESSALHEALHEPQSKVKRHKSSKEHTNRTKALKSTNKSSKEHKLKSTKNRTNALKSTSLKAQKQSSKEHRS